MLLRTANQRWRLGKRRPLRVEVRQLGMNIAAAPEWGLLAVQLLLTVVDTYRCGGVIIQLANK